MATIPIYQMNSFSRSGETLLLRNLSAHPQIEVVHQVREPDTKEDLELFRFLQKWQETSIDSSHPAVRHRKLLEGQVLLLKNAVWIHPAKWKGFVLIRNPFSVINSCRVLKDTQPEARENHRRQANRWGRGIDKNLLTAISQTNNFQAFCMLWSRKMAEAYLADVPIVRYEEFVTDPETQLRQIVAHLGLEWSDDVMTAHDAYEEGEIGHGKIKLWRPIHAHSLDGYMEIDPKDRARIYALCGPVMRLYGYSLDDDGRVILS